MTNYAALDVSLETTGRLRFSTKTAGFSPRGKSRPVQTRLLPGWPTTPRISVASEWKLSLDCVFVE